MLHTPYQKPRHNLSLALHEQPNPQLHAQLVQQLRVSDKIRALATDGARRRTGHFARPRRGTFPGLYLPPRQCPGVAHRVAQSKAASDQAALANPRWLAFVCWSQTASADRQAPLGRSATSFDRAIPGVPLGTQAKVAPCAVNDNPPPCALLVSKDGPGGPTFLCNVATAPTI